MRQIQRRFSKKLSKEEVNQLVDTSVKLIREIAPPEKLILFGSALTDRFDEYSDLDFVLIYDSIEEAKSAQHKLYAKTTSFPTSVDFVCVDKESYNKRSKTGGVFFIAAAEGRNL